MAVPTTPPPTGYVYLTGSDGAYLQGPDGRYLLEALTVPVSPSVYRLLRPHYLAGGLTPPDAVITEGTDVPNFWVPTLAVDPLNNAAAEAYYNAGPRDGGVYEDTNFWAGTASARPVTYWQRTGFPVQYWSLTGLGAGFQPISVPGTGEAPRGFVYLVGADGAFLLGSDGAYLLGLA